MREDFTVCAMLPITIRSDLNMSTIRFALLLQRSAYAALWVASMVPFVVTFKLSDLNII